MIKRILNLFRRRVIANNLITKTVDNGIVSYNNPIGNFHNPHRPAYNGSIYKVYLLKGYEHNIVGPSTIFDNGYTEYKINGKKI